MAKKNLKKVKRGGRKAARRIRKHGPWAAAVAAISGIATSILASSQLRDLMNELVDSAVHRVTEALNRRTEGRRQMANGVAADDHEDHEEAEATA